jgi:hypothetical protein
MANRISSKGLKLSTLANPSVAKQTFTPADNIFPKGIKPTFKFAFDLGQ